MSALHHLNVEGKLDLVTRKNFQQLRKEVLQDLIVSRGDIYQDEIAICFLKRGVIWGAAQHRSSARASLSAAPGSILVVPKKFSDEFFLILLRLINGTSQSVESLNMLIKPSSTSQWQASTTKIMPDSLNDFMRRQLKIMQV